MILERAGDPRATPRLSESYVMTVDSVNDPDLAILRGRIARMNARYRGKKTEFHSIRRVVVMARMGENVGKFGHLYRGRRRGYQNIALEHGARFDVYVYNRTVYED